jgi:hypothetical protein
MMDLSEILSIAGRPGLFKMVAKSKNNVIVESLIDKKRFPAFASDRMSSLEEISVFTDGDNIPIKDVLKKMYEKHGGGPSIDSSSDGNTLRKYFEEIVPDFDKERVYNSDIKKVIAWYNLLQKENLLDFTEEAKNEEMKEGETAVEPDIKPDETE